ncbi:glycosyltransferase family 4 protein [Kaistia adipata]|uniref:glycosyltransferase family 4 protein n=1 Tax=Kaistia adipata TaxID=166954 RepID=UPI0003F6852A|nr:glycosyltransferase family 4 protein [Kaistia adipata]
MSPPRILQILPDGSAGGGATAVLGLCEDLMRSGAFEPTLLTQPGSPVAASAAAAGIPVATLDFFTARLDPRLPVRLRRLIARIRPDLVHAHGARAALPLAMPGLQPVGPLAYTVHGYHHANKTLPWRWLGRAAERRIARRADAVIFVSEGDRARADREAILPRDDARGRVIPNGIDPADFVALPPAEARFDLIFAGRAHPQKNPLLLVEIMERLAGSGLTLLMISGGPLETALEARIAKSPARAAITHVGARPRRDILAAFRAARLLVMPSLWEGLPITPLEALHLGLPILASNVDGTSELLTDGVDACLIDGFSADRYAAAIRELLGDPPRLARLAANGRRLVATRHLRQLNAEAHAALYRRLLAARPDAQ